MLVRGAYPTGLELEILRDEIRSALITIEDAMRLLEIEN